MNKALITGIAGQDGFWLTKHLLSQGYEVYGTVRRNPAVDAPILTLLPSKNLLYADMTNASQLYEAISKIGPTEIYNLAAQSFPPSSWKYSWQTFDVNAGGFARILEIVEALNPKIKIFQASTADMFGPVEGPCNEETPMNPGTPYGISKLAAHKMAALYRKKGLFISTCIMFNHDSALRGTGFVTSKIVDHLVKYFVLSNEHKVLNLGFLDGYRDWGFAGDYVKAMYESMQTEFSGDYVIGSGQPHSVREFLELAILSIREFNVKTFIDSYVRSDSNLKRPNETLAMCADFSKAKQTLGWYPTTNFTDMIDMMVKETIEYERTRSSKPTAAPAVLSLSERECSF